MKTNTLDFDAQALREKILDLAMRGKLVPQDPNDEPASELMKNNDLKSSDEKPHDIPDSWEWVVLGSGVKFINGRAYKKVELLEDNSLTPVLRVGNLFTNSSWYYSNLNLDSDKYIDNGDLIYAWSASFGPRIWDGGHVIYHYHIWKLILDQAIDKNYLYYFLLDKRNVIGETDLHGSTMKHITKTNMEHLSFPLPPLSEQSRIAAKIAQLFALLRKVESSIQQYANLKDLLKSKLLDLAMRGKLVDQDPNDEPANVLLDKIKAEKDQLVKEKKIKSLPEITDDEKPFDIPDSWEWVRLGDVLDVRDGTHDTPKYVSEGVPLITAKNLRNGEIDFSNIKYISENDAIKINERSQVSEGDVLFAMIGTIGNPVLVRTRNNFSIKNVALLKQIAFLNMNFVCQYILGSTKLLMKNASGGNQKFISLKKINKLPFPLPPLSEQSRIVSKLEQLFTLIG